MDVKFSIVPKPIDTEINEAPRFTNVPATVPVVEHIASGSSVYTVSYLDNDAVQTHVITLAPNSYFEIDPTSKSSP